MTKKIPLNYPILGLNVGLHQHLANILIEKIIKINRIFCGSFLQVKLGVFKQVE